MVMAVTAVMAALASSAFAFQAPAVDVQEAFEAGAHEQVVAAAQGSDDPRTIYLAGLPSHTGSE